MSLKLLIAYPYLNNLTVEVLQKAPDLDLLVDSGAFTAWKAGKSIKVEDYCAFIKGLPFKDFKYFTLDVVGDKEGTLKNYEYMRSQGLSPIPIFTRGENISVLEEYYKTSDYVGVGGLVQTKGNTGFVSGISELISGRKVHWLGFTRLEFVQKFKPYSIDSSSWSSGIRYGSLILYNRKLKKYTLNRNHFSKIPSKEIFDLLEFYDEDYKTFQNNNGWINRNSSGLHLFRISCKAEVLKMILIDKAIGTKSYIAVANAHDIKNMIDAYNFWRKKWKN